jgi:glycosyltransferase involved in cell wall biosynthesis
MRKYVIGYYDDSKSPGGTTRYLLTLLSGLNRDEFEPILFALVDRAWHKDAAALGVKIVLLKEPQDSTPVSAPGPVSSPRRRITLPKKIAWTLGIAREISALQRLFNKHAVDLLHSNNAGAEPAPIAARISRVPCVLATWHVDPSYDLENLRNTWNYRLLEMASMRAPHHNIAVSKATACAWIRRCLFSSRRAVESITIVHNGVDVAKLSRAASIQTAKIKHGWDDRLVIGSVGRLDAAKGYEYLLRALPEVFNRYEDIVVRIAGSGELLEQLRDMAAQLGLGDRVEFLGFTANVKDFLESIDIYVQPSLCEALPMAILEASAVGVPVVASDVGGVAECIVDGETGYVVPPRDPEALGNAIAKLVFDPSLRIRMGKAASRLIRERFRDDQMVNATQDVYRDLLGAMKSGTSDIEITT